jgi:AraC-like DNA-binding protein
MERLPYTLHAQCRVSYLGANDPRCRVLADHGVRAGGLSHMRVRYVSAQEDGHNHNVMFTLRGRAELHTAERMWVMEAGMVHVVPAGYDQWQVRLEDGEWDVVWFHLRSTPEWSSLVLHRAPYTKHSFYGSQLANTVSRYIAEFSHPSPISFRALPHLAELIVLDLRRELEVTDDPDILRLQLRLARLWNEVAQQPARPWSIEELAANCGFSAQYFRRLVRKQYGISPVRMLQGIRLELAKEFLLATNWTLARIAEKVGYASPYALSTAFKRTAQMSPKQFRKSRGAPAPTTAEEGEA